MAPDSDPMIPAFGIGQPVRRTEDPKLLRGAGRYTDDVNLDGQAYAVMVRSPHAHGILKAIDATEALAMPGVLAVYTGADLAEYGGLKCPVIPPDRHGKPMLAPRRPILPADRIRFAGEAVAYVVAETALQARDAAELVLLDIEPLPAVTEARAALEPGAPQIHPDVPGNLALDFHYGDADAVAAAFAAAAHVSRLDLVNNRIIVNAMEPRAALGQYRDGRWILHVGCQGVFGLRNALAADVLNVAPNQVQILTGQVGGSFGMKAGVYPEYVCLLHAARDLGRPVKWTDARSESFMSDNHGRAHEMEAELALDAEGKFLAVRLTGYGNTGAYPGLPVPVTMNAVKNVLGVYRTPLVEVSSKMVYTNTSIVGPYRGAGRPEGNYYMERLIDTAAAEMGIDRVALRRLNHIAPDAMPYKAPSGMAYDSGEFGALMEQALGLADWNGYAARQAASTARGKLRGRGIGSYLEVNAPPSKEMGGLRFEEDGTVTMVTGTLDYGQGHAATFAQIVVEHLGLPFDTIRLLQGDSDQLIAGGGTGGSRSTIASGTALIEAAELVIEKGREAAAVVLEAATVDIDFLDGQFGIVGTDRRIGVIELARQVRMMTAAGNAPADLPDTLDVSHISDNPPSAFPNGCHIAEVEIDPDTGVVEVAAYAMVNDFGTVINPLLVEGQLHGGVLQGIGQALLEHVVYDAQGQLLTGSFMDYAMPRAIHAPPFRFASHPVPATTNPLGAKGCGEAGCAGALPAVMNALVDALAPYGIRHFDIPATPEKVWQAIQAA